MPVYELASDVLSCTEAASAKSIPLENELKTLIITTGTQKFALHIRGDRRASLRKVKRFLNSEQAYMVSPQRLAEMGLKIGTVSPVLEPVWSLPHLISQNILDLDFVSTNNGTRHGFFRFSPRVLLEARSSSVGDFDA